MVAGPRLRLYVQDGAARATTRRGTGRADVGIASGFGINVGNRQGRLALAKLSFNVPQPRTLTQIVVPVLVAGAVAIALVVLVVALARRNRRTAHLEQEWYTLTEATSEWRQRFNAALATALRNEGAGAAAAVKEPELLPPPPTHNRLFVFSEADSCEKATSGDTEHIELAEMDEDGMMMGQPNVLGGRQDDGESNL